MSPTILLAPDSFKGSLGAGRFCEVAEEAILRARPDATVIAHPLADGGEGTLEALAGMEGAERITHSVPGPLGRPVRADSLWFPAKGTAVIEMAQASGLQRLPAAARSPLKATTRGTGELLRHALHLGARRIIVTLGGSATTDAGTGLLAALGYRFLDDAGRPLPPGGGALERLARIEAPDSGLPREVELLGATDVTVPLLGPTGAARLFAPQKGASPAEVEWLERGLARFAEVAARDLGLEVAEAPGAGAAGGLGAALLLLGGRLTPGFALIAGLTGFEAHFRRQRLDLVITGEGRLDHQSAHGKVPVEVAKVAAGHEVPVVALAGEVALPPAEVEALGFHTARSLADPTRPLEENLVLAEKRLAEVIREELPNWL